MIFAIAHFLPRLLSFRITPMSLDFHPPLT
jgi:hypothetical protein